MSEWSENKAPNWKIGFDKRRYTGGSTKVFLKVTTKELAELFEVTRRTIRRWVRLNRLDPTSLTDIVEKYNDPRALDKRKK